MSATVLWLFLLFNFSASCWACLPSELHIREQWVDAYVKRDGPKVTAHRRSEHCRSIGSESFYKDRSSSEISGIGIQLKDWNEHEKSIVTKEYENLPVWLKKYKIASLLRLKISKTIQQ